MVTIIGFNFSRHGWKFDRKRIEKFCEGRIERDIVLRRPKLQGTGIGYHGFIGKKNNHFIEIKTNLTLWWANRVLLHELCHAIQSERFPDIESWEMEYGSQGKFADVGHKYKETNEFEKEADFFAEALNDHYCLLKGPEAWHYGIGKDRIE